MSRQRTGMMACAAAAFALAASGSPAAAQGGVWERLQIHGYMSQGYVASSDLPIHGIPTDGTADYRNAALQFRYALSDNDFAVIQLKHRRLGTSVFTSTGSDVELNWAFYQRRFGSASVRVGRVPLPGGIFNETRDVGTLLPFYRAPANFYLEGIETLDGVVASYDREVGAWGVEAHASYGGFSIKLPLMTPAGPQVLEERLENAAGGQFWLRTPVQGVRVGVNGSRWSNAEEGQPAQTLWGASVDVNRQRFFARGEYSMVELHIMRTSSYYAQGGIRFGRLSLNGQGEWADMKLPTPFGPVQMQIARDLAVGVNFAQSPNLVYKLEAHTTKGYNYDVYLDPLQGKGETDYLIGSISVSF